MMCSSPYPCSTITLTRKLFTMLLSVIVYKHKLTPGQWLGTAVVFAGISVEAYVKRKGLPLSPTFQPEANPRHSGRGAREARHSREGEGKDQVSVDDCAPHRCRGSNACTIAINPVSSHDSKHLRPSPSPIYMSTSPETLSVPLPLP